MLKPLTGAKNDGGKNRLDLVPASALWEVGRVMTFGAGKYGDRNWLGGLAYGRLFAAMMRHAWSWWRGEERDEESGIHHLAHAAACSMMLLEYCMRRNDGGSLDDRENGQGAAVSGAGLLGDPGRST